MISSIISRLVILVFGTLYPAYASYKAVRTKNLKEYVKWMMYWIVFALFTCTETFTDVFLSWFPFYYEVKIVLVLWLLSPATKGSSILYRKFVHPALCRREQEIDEYIAKAKDQGYHTVLNLGTKGVNYATTVIMQTAIKGGGGLVQQIRKSYSLSDLTECEPREEHAADEVDDVLSEPRLIRRAIKSAYATRRSASESNSRQAMYFPEVDVDVRGPRPRLDEPDFSHIKSTEDISSGYSSAENSASLTRAGSVGARSRARTTRTTVTTIKRPPAAEDKEVIIEELQEDDFDNTMPPLLTLSSPLYLSHTVPPFIYQYVEDQVKIIQVLGNYPLSSDSQTENSCLKLQRDQNITESNERTEVEIEKPRDVNSISRKDNNFSISEDIQDTNNPDDEIHGFDTIEIVNKTDDSIESNTQSSNNNYLLKENLKTDIAEEFIDTESVNTSENDNYSTESDDEASYVTPEPTPKSVKKQSKGKYGKNKAPLPPQSNVEETKLPISIVMDKITCEKSEQDDQLTDSPQLEANSQILNNLAVDKSRSKSKSPVRHTGSNLGLGKLLQFPSKLAFWAKGDEKSKSDISISDYDSRQSSGKFNDEFQSCSDITNKQNINEVDNDTKTVEIVDIKENVTQDIKEKSDELQKVIEAKLDRHPEYKFVPLHDEVNIMSKSTDV